MARPQLNSEIGQVSADGHTVVMSRRLYDLLLELVPNPNPAVTSPTVGPSPWLYTNTSGYTQDVLLIGGTVTLVQFGRAGSFYSTTAPVRLSPGDQVRVTYTAAPSAAIIPR